jgi:TonB-linked SusC/RagA family outer membrane protein
MKKSVPLTWWCRPAGRLYLPLILGLTAGPTLATPTPPNWSAPVPIATAGFHQDDITITGLVKDDKGVGLPGVNVVIKGTTQGSATDANGRFTIKVPSNNTVLVFSYIGYKTQETTVGTQTQLTMTLVADDQSLDEVVVVGYGTQSRGTVTGAVSTVQSDDLLKTPAVTSSAALVGKVQGITSRATDSRPGGAVNIEVRNMGEPLYVIDGVPADAGQFNNLGQNDIENISILKDASAAIYGLRAANGVVLVTTRKGRANQKTAINLNGYYGFQDFSRYPYPANAYQHQRGLVESDQNLGIRPSITPEELEKWRVGTEKGYQNYDYYKMVLRSNVPQYSLNASVTGGANNANYYVAVNHLDQKALIEDFSFKRTNLQANLEAGLTKGLRIGAQISGRVETRKQTGVPGIDDYFNPLLSVFSMWPTERPYANDNPNYIAQTHNINVNPATYKKSITGYNDEIWRAAKANLYAQYDFGFGLIAKATFSYNHTALNFDGFEYTYNTYNYNPQSDSYSVVPGGGNQNPWREQRRRTLIDQFGQFQLTYNKQFGDHGIAAVAAVERSDWSNRYLVVHTVPPNNYIPIQYFANQDYLADEYGEVARAGYIGRVNYNYKQKYLLEVLGRYDGSFLFAPGRRYGFFPGVSVGWRLLEEPVIKNAIGSVVSDFKLRASWGKTGSDNTNNNQISPGFIVAPFSYLTGYNWGAGSSLFNGTLTTGIQPRGIPITNLSWINNVSTNLGFDFSLFNSRLSGTFDVFQRKRTGLPAARYDVLLPSEVGYSLPPENLNTEFNKGMEGSINYSGKAGKLTYTIGANATYSRYQAGEQYKPRFGNSWDQYRNAQLNRWGGTTWGYHVTGRFQSAQDIANHPINNDGQGNRTMLPGDFIYQDVNGDGIINYLDERPIGYAQGWPPFMNFGLNANLSWQNFTLFVGFAGGTMQSLERNWELKFPYQNNGTSPAYMLEDRWHRSDPYNPDSPWVTGLYPAIRKDYGSHANNWRNDFWVTNVTYLRLRNLELGYNLPKPVMDRLGLTALRVYLSGTNLLSFDNVKQYEIDPEIASGNGLVYPTQRLYSAGFNLSF